MNFLAHLLLADTLKLPLAGAILGDIIRGRIEANPDRDPASAPPQSAVTPSGAAQVSYFPADLALSIRLHRRIDATTDRHPGVLAAVQRFEPGHRRYAGILLDLIYDHVLAVQWRAFAAESLECFARRAAFEVAAAGPRFVAAGAGAPVAWRFRSLLVSYRSTGGMDVAIRRTAARLRRPEGLLDASQNWERHVPAALHDLPGLLKDLTEASRDFVRDQPHPAA